MTDKRKAQGGSKGKSLEALKASAAEIIADVRGYDADTRRAVWLARESLRFAETDPQPPTEYTDAGYCERGLRDTLEKVKTGVPMFDAERFNPLAVAHAFNVYTLLEPGDADVGAPDFIIGAVRVALDAAAHEVGLEIWLDVDGSGDSAAGGLSVARIAYLFERVGVCGPELEPKKDLAGLISAVLNHPETPGRLYNKLSEAVGELAVKDDVIHQPEVIRAALAFCASEQEGGADE